MPLEFTNLKAGEQRVELYKEIHAVKDDVAEIKNHMEKQNGKLNRHDRNLWIVNVVLITLVGMLIYFFTGQVISFPIM